MLLLAGAYEIALGVLLRHSSGSTGHFIGAGVLGLMGLLQMPWLGVNARALLGLVFLAVVTTALVFGPAGTFHYWQGWVYFAISFASSCFNVFYLMRKNPELLKRRLRAGALAERYVVQKIIMLFFSIGFVALIVVSAFDHRNGWSTVPVFLVIAGDVLLIAGYYIVFRVFKENTFASATIQIADGQQVISTGPYTFIRHPMYGGAVMLNFGTPLALGSCIGLIVSLAMIPVLIGRILHEEKILVTSLPGYREYQKQVRWRLLPGLF